MLFLVLCCAFGYIALTAVGLYFIFLFVCFLVLVLVLLAACCLLLPFPCTPGRPRFV